MTGKWKIWRSMLMRWLCRVAKSKQELVSAQVFSLSLFDCKLALLIEASRAMIDCVSVISTRVAFYFRAHFIRYRCCSA